MLLVLSSFRPWITLAVWVLFALIPTVAWAAPGPSAIPGGMGQSPGSDDALVGATFAEKEQPFKWFFMVAGVNSHPRLESEDLIDDYLNTAMKVLAPDYDDVRTVGTLRDSYMLWPPHIGIGRALSDRWTLFFQTGYSSGTVRTKATDPSILFLLPLHTDFEMKRGAFYAGLGLDYFPWGQVEVGDYDGLMPRLRAAKPALGARVTWTYATYEAKAQVGVGVLTNLINYKESGAWGLWSGGLNGGFDMPFTKRTTLSFNAGYNFFPERAFDFAGASYTIALKYHFQPNFFRGDRDDHE
ncbi:MAG: hypothetical protein GY851_33575 [bacterium]|nr:hypothetical protein [bacterium]